ncbi:MAG: ABC transporter ATP-binding protein, partial [Anaerolineae bacterium]
MKDLFRTVKYLKPYLLMTILALFALLISTVSSLAVPALSQRLFDQGIQAKDQRVITTLALVMVGIAVLGGLFTFLQGYLTAKVSQGVAYDLRNVLYEKIQRLSFSYHDRAQTGQLLTRVTNDVELVQQFLGTAILQALGAVILLVGSIGLMVSTSPQTAAVLLGLAPIALLIFFIFFRKARPLFRKRQERLEKLNVVLQENLAGVRVVRAFVRRAHELARFAARNQSLMEVEIQTGRIMALAIPLIFFIANVARLSVTWVGG